MRIISILAGAALLMAGPQARARDACESFKWDASREHALFIGEATPIKGGIDVGAAPTVALGTLYDFALSPQEQVQYAAPASKKMLTDGAYGGMVRFRVPRAGQYRVSESEGFWLDVANAGKTIPSIDFNGSPGCDKPRKIVVYELPADTDLTLQLSGATEEHVHVTLTPVATPPK